MPMSDAAPARRENAEEVASGIVQALRYLRAEASTAGLEDLAEQLSVAARAADGCLAPQPKPGRSAATTRGGSSAGSRRSPRDA